MSADPRDSGECPEETGTDAADASEGQELKGGLLNDGFAALFNRARKKTGRVRQAARELRRSPAYPHAIAARERGNLEAAFWLLTEEFEHRRDAPEVAVAYWDVACELGRPRRAVEAAVGLVQRHSAAGDLELAVVCWSELVRAVPDALVSPTLLAGILPELRRRAASTSGEDRNAALELVRTAMRHAIDSRNETPSPGVALRIFEEGRDVHPDAAASVAEIALESESLHAEKRTRLESWLREQRGGEPEAPPPHPKPEPEDARQTTETTPPPERPAHATARPGGASDAAELAEPAKGTESKPAEKPKPDAAPSTRPNQNGPSQPRERSAPPTASEPSPRTRRLQIIEALPVELTDTAVEICAANERRTRVTYDSIEAVSAVEIRPEGEDPFVFVDLVLNWMRRTEAPLRIVRLRSDTFAPADPSQGGTGNEPLALMLGELMERARAVPLPDPDSALGLNLASFASVPAYESQVLGGT